MAQPISDTTRNLAVLSGKTTRISVRYQASSFLPILYASIIAMIQIGIPGNPQENWLATERMLIF